MKKSILALAYALLMCLVGVVQAAIAGAASVDAAVKSARTVGDAPRTGAGAVDSASPELYVAADGLDSNPGSQSRPFRSIDRAARAATAGATVHVAPGIYKEVIKTTQSGTLQAPIRYVSTVRWGARIIGNGKDAVWTNHGSFVDIAGFDISGSGRIGILNLGSHTLIENNHVHHLAVSGGCTPNGGAGIDNGNYASSDGDIIGNVVHDIGVPGACNGVHGIYSSNLRGRIVNNMVFRAASFGIHLWHAATNVVVANNTVFANGSATMGGGIVLGNGDSPGGAVLNHTQVVNNIVYDNPGVSIKEFCYAGHDCTGANNLFANNLVFGNGAPIALRRGRPRNTIAADPQFVNYRPDGSGNYRLLPTSPANAKGLAIKSVADVASLPGGRAAKGRTNIGASVDIPSSASSPPIADAKHSTR